jgi:branched-chain amino acid transport system permease protein
MARPLLGGMFPDRTRDVALPAVGSLALFAIIVLGGLAAQALIGGSTEQLVTSMLIDAIVVVGIQVYIGNTGVLSFGHIGFGAIAGYTFAVLAIDPARKATVISDAPWNLDEVQLSPMMATLVAVVVTVLVAIVVGIGLARSGAQSGAVAATVITLALLFVTRELAVNWTDLTGGDRAGLSFSVGHTLGTRIPIYIVLAVSILIARWFACSRSGRLAHAAREDNLAARAIGIDPQVQQMVALVLSVAIVAVAASLRVYEIGNITPKFFFFEYTLITLVMLIVGGRNSVTGALTGVVVITVARELARRMAGDGYELFGLGLDGSVTDIVFREGLPDIVLGVAMLGFMILRPNGLLDDWELDRWIGDRLQRRRATPPPAADQATAATTGDERLEVAGLVVEFGGFRAADEVSIAVRAPQIVGLIGPNGAGKTTVVNGITGIVPTSAGSFGLARDLTGEPTHRIARAGLVRTFQNLRLFGALTVRDNVEAAALMAALTRTDRVRPDVDQLLVEADLWELRDRRARQLDYGNSRRLELARAVAMAPTILLLDEPTSGMSDSESMAMVSRVRRMAELVGAGVLVIDHDLNFITGICDDVYCLDQGEVIAHGTPAEIQADPAVQAAYLGTATHPALPD